MRPQHVVRVGGAVLAALVVGGAATTAGTATAGAEAVLFGSSTGSIGGETPWRLDEALDQLRPCVYEWGFPDSGPCYTNGFHTGGTLGAYSAWYSGPQEVAPGAVATFGATVVASEAAFDVSDPQENVDVTRVTFLPPKGFEYVSVKVTGYTPSETPDLPAVNLDSTAVVDPDSGEITVTAPEGGWGLAPGRNGGKFEGGSVRIAFTLRAPDERVTGSISGFTLTGTSVPASDGWVATGTTRVWPEPADGTGS